MLLTLSLLALASSCRGGSSDNASDVLTKTVNHLDAAQSYRVISTETEAARPLSPDRGSQSYWFEFEGEVVRELRGAIPIADQECLHKMDQGLCNLDATVMEGDHQELVYTPSMVYSRLCDPACSEWLSDASMPDFFGPLGEVRRTRISDLLSNIVSARIVRDDQGLIEISGSFNPVRIGVLTTQREISASCSLSGTPTPNQAIEPGGDPCDPDTFAAFEENNRLDLEAFDRSPAPIDVWIDSQTMLPKQVQITDAAFPLSEPRTPGDIIDTADFHDVFEFSDYGGVTVTVPSVSPPPR